MERSFPDEAFTKRVINAFINSDDYDKDHYGFLMKLFAYDSYVTKYEFQKEMTGECNWFFKSKEICEQLKPYYNEAWVKTWEEET